MGLGMQGMMFGLDGWIMYPHPTSYLIGMENTMGNWQAVREIPHGKHKGKMLWTVVRDDPNYALHAHATYSWFPKLDQAQIKDCNERYRHLPRDLRTGLHLRDWSTYDMADYGDDWV